MTAAIYRLLTKRRGGVPLPETTAPMDGAIYHREDLSYMIAHPHYQLGASIAADRYAPVAKTHRISLEQMAILEPAMIRHHR